MTRLLISDEVRALLTTATVERIIAQREHTELTCTACGATITPEMPDAVSVIVRFDSTRNPVVQYEHATCSPSRIDRDAVLAKPPQPRLTYVPVLLAAGCRVSATLIWEPTSLVVASQSAQALTVVSYAQHGFAAPRAPIDKITGPVLRGWVLASDGPDLVLRHNAEPIEHFNDITTTAPPGWLEGARSQRRCLLVVGETLGLDRPSEERINALLQDGRAVAAIVLAKINR